MEEIWKPIERPYLRQGVYFVSNQGRVRREPFVYYAGEYKTKRIQEGGFIAQSTSNKKRSPKGYKFIVLWGSDRKQHSLFVHRLVAEAFLPEWNPDLTVNHKDEDTHNNSWSNLEMLSQKENNMASIFHAGRRMPVTLTHVITKEELNFNSLREAYSYLGISQFVLKNRIKQCKPVKRFLPKYSAPTGIKDKEATK